MECDFSLEHNVRQTTGRETIIAFEVQGPVGANVDSGAYIRRIPGKIGTQGFLEAAVEEAGATARSTSH